MAHPYHNHREMQVGHRRVKAVMKSGGYIRGSGVLSEADRSTFTPPKDAVEDLAERKAGGGAVARARLDKRARGGGVQKKADGGPIRKITPSKRKPHTNINIVNISRPHKPRGLMGPGISPLPSIPAAGAGLPVPPVAGGMPPPGGVPGGMPGGLGMRPPGMAKGGRMKGRQSGKIGKLWGGGPHGGASNGVARIALTRKTRKDYP